jgi:prepilin-type N-terminal cleavage/methylation domain-containing protein
MKQIKLKLEKGFTIVELMIATIIFSLVLLSAMAALVQIGKLYYKGISNARTQELTRNVIAEISQGIQFSRQPVREPTLNVGPEVALANPDNNGIGFFCVGPRRYTFIIDRKLSSEPDDNPDLAEREKESRHVLWVDTPNSGCSQDSAITPADLSQEDPCDPAIDTNNCSDGREIMTENMRLTKLVVQEASEDVWMITIAVAYGEDELLEVVDGRYVCEGSTNVSEFCSIAELSTTVLRRL